MLRFILVVIFLLLYFLLGIPVLGILWLIGKVNKPLSRSRSTTYRSMGI